MIHTATNLNKTKETPTHVTHKVVVKGTSFRARAWKGNLKLLASSSVVSDDTETTEDALSCSSSECSFDLVVSNKEKGIFSFYQIGDGSAEDVDDIPRRYVEAANQDRSLAFEAMQKTLGWRKENAIDEILNKPHVNYDICKAAIPHYFLGRDAQGHAVYLQQPALLDMDMARANKLDYDDLLNHSLYIQEYLWQIIEADNPMALVTNIIDVGDLRLSDIRSQKDRIEQLVRIATIMDAHYPGRANKTIIINAPSWFNLLYKLLKPAMRENSANTIEICSKGKKQDEILRQHLGDDTCTSLPDFCWSKTARQSTRNFSISQLQMERDLRDFVVSQIATKGRMMAPVLD